MQQHQMRIFAQAFQVSLHWKHAADGRFDIEANDFDDALNALTHYRTPCRVMNQAPAS
jgi:hypothetical protein